MGLGEAGRCWFRALVRMSWERAAPMARSRTGRGTGRFLEAGRRVHCGYRTRPRLKVEAAECDMA